MSMSDASRQLIWVQNLYSELGYEINGIDLFCDNQGAIFLASNPAQEHCSKHIDIRFHYIRQQVEDKKVRLSYIPTNEQLADLMTKNLSFDKLKFFRNALGITSDDITNVNYTRTLLPYWVLVKMPLKKFNKYIDQIKTLWMTNMWKP